MLRSICTRTWSGRPMLRGCRTTCTSLAFKVSLYCYGGAAVWRENRTIGAAVLSALVKYRQLCTLSLLGSLPVLTARVIIALLFGSRLSVFNLLACGPVTYNLLKLLKSTRLLKSPGLLNSPLHISSM